MVREPMTCLHCGQETTESDPGWACEWGPYYQVHAACEDAYNAKMYKLAMSGRIPM